MVPSMQVIVMGMDDVPTHRESGQLAVFEQTAVESLAKLDALQGPDDEQVRELKVEATSLVAVFQSWHTDPPIGEARSHAIERVMDLHRNVESLIAARR